MEYIVVYYFVDFIVVLSLGIAARHYFAQRTKATFLKHLDSIKDWSEARIRRESEALRGKL